MCRKNGQPGDFAALNFRLGFPFWIPTWNQGAATVLNGFKFGPGTINALSGA